MHPTAFLVAADRSAAIIGFHARSGVEGVSEALCLRPILNGGSLCALRGISPGPGVSRLLPQCIEWQQREHRYGARGEADEFVRGLPPS
jgi:hypothetical protein